MTRFVLPRWRNSTYLAVIWPLVLVIFLGLLAVFFSHQSLAYAVWCGGLVWFVPNIYTAFTLFHRIETSAPRFVMLLYRTEVIKLMLVALLFIAIVKFFPVSFIGMLAGYIIAQMFFWILLGVLLYQ